MRASSTIDWPVVPGVGLKGVAEIGVEVSTGVSEAAGASGPTHWVSPAPDRPSGDGDIPEADVAPGVVTPERASANAVGLVAVEGRAPPTPLSSAN